MKSFSQLFFSKKPAVYHPSRRSALLKLSLGAGALSLGTLPHYGLGAEKLQTTPKKLGIALVGLGNYSTQQLAPALQETKLCKLAGIVTGSPEKAKSWAQKYIIPQKNIYNYTNFDSIKDNPDIDIVYVVLPNAMHAEYTIRAAQAGKHVICEKPMSLSVKEGQEMIDACQKANRLLSVGYRLYFEPHHLEVRRLGLEKVYGEIKMIEASLGFSMANPNSWRLDKKLGGGGAIVDLGLYAIQGARRVTGQEPTSVRAQAFTIDKTIFKGIPETVFWQMEFPGGILSNSSTTYTSYVDRLYVTAQRGWFGLMPAFNALGQQGNTSNGPITFKTPAYQQITQMDDFADCILNNRKSIVSGEEALKDIRVLEAIFQSIESRQEVRIA
jgi:predicted dehydrogenase